MSDTDQDKPFYIVPMFPYPSGRLHMGHVRNYSISDAIANHYRRQGREVIHPIGWDAFGLPAENAARANGVDPRAWTDQNIDAMRRQLQDLGIRFDNSFELATHHPDYMAHGQRLFLAFLKAGMIERRTGEVWWDPVDKTVLANEQVVNGLGWRSGAVVERKTLSMLFAKTSLLASDLSDDLSDLEWPDQAVAAQKAWIGAKNEDGPRLRDWCISRQRSWGTPIPLLSCADCGEIPATDDMLPLKNLPTHPVDADLACACPVCGGSARRSEETLDTFWDSSFYTYCYPDTKNGVVEAVAGDGFKKCSRVDLYVGGLEHSTMHLLYARWFARALREIGVDVDKEPFRRLIGQGMVRAPAYHTSAGQNPVEWVSGDQVVKTQDGQGWMTRDGVSVSCVGSVKMSKSKNNGVDPTVFVETYGAEAVRFAMLFAAPYAIDVDWSEDVVRVAHSHLKRMAGQADLIAGAPHGEVDPILQKAGDALSLQVVASYEGREGINAMMGSALGLWRAAQRAARDGRGAAARAAAGRVVEALWPVASQTMTQIMTTINPEWRACPVAGSSGLGGRPPLVVQVNGLKRAVVENPGLDSAAEALEYIRTRHPDINIGDADGVERMVWVPGRVLNIIPKKRPSIKP